MLNTEKTTKIKGNAKTVLAVALVAIVSFAVACTKTLTNIEKDQNLSEMKVAQGQNQEAITKEYIKELDMLTKKYPQWKIDQESLKEAFIAKDASKLKISNVSNVKDEERMAFLLLNIRNQSIDAKIEDKSEMDKNGVYSMVEKNASPIGGIQEVYKIMGKNMKYPQQAVAEKVEGKVYVQFVIDTDGSLKDIEVVKGIGAGCGCRSDACDCYN